MTDQLPAPIARFVETTNAADSEAFVALFTDDARLEDWGRVFHGRDGAAAWNQSDNIGKRSHFDVVDIEPGDAEATYVLTVTVSGDGFNGTSPITFVVRDDLIEQMLITP